MDLRDIEYFAVIAEHGHLGRAAEALGLGQPALSISLRRLEQAAEAKLVNRTPKGVALTAVGSALLSHVRRLQLAREDLAREVADLAHGRAGHLRIASSPANEHTLLPEVASSLLTEAPKLTLGVEILGNEALLPTLRRGEVDLVVAHVQARLHGDLEQEVIGEDEFVVYCSTYHRLAKRKAVTLADLAGERWACTPGSATTSWLSLQRTFEDRGMAPPLLALVSNSPSLRHRAVGSSNLIGLGTRRALQADAVHPRLVMLRVTDFAWIRPVAVLYRKDAYLPPAARRFIEILKATAKKIASKQ